ncbi:MAG: hypothetical protein HRU20_27445 [Pseudomonadales bacterium]|nr:hypothetical protein [Pseudomonadales bacterium]
MIEGYTQIKREFYSNSLKEWFFWLLGSLIAVVLIRWFSNQYGAPEYPFHIWVSATLYLWYISSISLIISSTYFIARAAQTFLERREKHPQKPHAVDLSKDIVRVKNIKQRAAIIAIVGHLLNAVFVYFVAGLIPDITGDFRLYAVFGVIAIAVLKPSMMALNAIRLEIFGMMEEADYPQKSVADLWSVVDEFTDYEKRLESIFERIDDAEKHSKENIDQALLEFLEKLEAFKQQLRDEFEQQVQAFKVSDTAREDAYHALQLAQQPLTKEVSKILNEIQSLKAFVIELRDKNIKGEQLMSALKEFGIDSLADLNVSFQKSITQRNPVLESAG